MTVCTVMLQNYNEEKSVELYIRERHTYMYVYVYFVQLTKATMKLKFNMGKQLKTEKLILMQQLAKLRVKLGITKSPFLFFDADYDIC